MNNPDITKPTRQSVKGLVPIFIQSVRLFIKVFWPVIIALAFKKDIAEKYLLVEITVVVLLILLLVHTVLYYLNFYFYVKNNEFVLKKGYIRKKVLNIPLDRIQSVNTKQNLIQQILNIVSLEVDTAGSVGKELKIHALEKSFAGELQILLQSGKAKSGGDEDIVEENREKPILELSPADLFRIGISQNHLRTGLLILVFGNQIFQNIQDLFKDKTEKYSNDFVEFMSNSGVAIAISVILFFLIVSILFSLFRTVFKYYGFKLVKTDGAYRIESGLINKRNVIIPHNKVQQLNWETGPVKKLFGIFHITFKQAVSKQQKNNQLVDAPGCLGQHLKQLRFDLFGDDGLNQVPRIYSNRFYFRRLWILSGWLPILLAAPFLYAEIAFIAGAVVWLAVTAGYNFLILKKRYFRMNSEQIRISQGAVSHIWKQMELFKIQSVRFKQSFFQKRRSLASLVLMNAAGSITIPYIDEQVAKQIYNYVLFHTEISEKRWM